MNFLKKILFFLFVLAPLLWLTSPRSSAEKKDFSLETISSRQLFHPEWEVRALTAEEAQEVETSLSQPYRYLGSGGQCMTFSSQDDKHVIKFFKQRKFAIPEWIERFPVPVLIDWLRVKKMKKREEKRSKVFSAFILSFDHLAEESGLLYVHLNPTAHLQKILSVKDPKGKEHLLPLDELEFVVQRKAELAYVAIDALVAQEKMGEAKQAIDQLLALQSNIRQKGFRNRDPNFRHNYGFIGSQPILIDVGRIVRSEQEFKKDPMITSRFRGYLSLQHPELLSHFDQSVEGVKK